MLKHCFFFLNNPILGVLFQLNGGNNWVSHYVFIVIHACVHFHGCNVTRMNRTDLKCKFISLIGRLEIIRPWFRSTMTMCDEDGLSAFYLGRCLKVEIITQKTMKSKWTEKEATVWISSSFLLPFYLACQLFNSKPSIHAHWQKGST